MWQQDIGNVLRSFQNPLLDNLVQLSPAQKELLLEVVAVRALVDMSHMMYTLNQSLEDLMQELASTRPVPSAGARTQRLST